MTTAPDVPINSFVLPVVEANLQPDGLARIERFRGTGFVIGGGGVVITAAHVVSAPSNELAVATPGQGGGLRIWTLGEVEEHTSEDVAVGRVAFGSETPYSPLLVHDTPQFGSAQWMVWGYPEDSMYEAIKDGVAAPTPELAYVGGYVRRQLPSYVDVPKVRGQKLYECGGLAGTGCSGSPVILTRSTPGNWLVIGVYVGERLAAERGQFVSYVTRLDELAGWAPATLGRTLLEESAAR